MPIQSSNDIAPNIVSAAAAAADKVQRPDAVRYMRRKLWRILRSYDPATWRTGGTDAALAERAARIIQEIETGVISDENSRVAGALVASVLRDIAQ